MIDNCASSRQIFVSYAQSDQTFVARLADDLSRSGAKVWLDIRNAQPGRHWGRSIEQALSACGMMLVVLSPGALECAHVTVEWQAYLEANRPVIPILLKPCDPPGPLRTRRPVDFRHERDYSRSFHQLVTRLIDSGTRVRRTDPVIWTLSEHVNEYRGERALVRASVGMTGGSTEGTAQDGNSNGLRGMVERLRDKLRRI